jgi:hypothetical protein
MVDLDRNMMYSNPADPFWENISRYPALGLLFMILLPASGTA